MKVSVLTVMAAVIMAVAVLTFGDEELNVQFFVISDDAEKVVETSFRDLMEVLGLKDNEEESRACSRAGEYCYKSGKCCDGLYCKAYVVTCYKA
uniref:U7-Theraphotoxin-Ct1a_1 n=1 Tax=Coremiocnemis tropix TaxID=1904443 RepID=A0A482Z7I1_CORTR